MHFVNIQQVMHEPPLTLSSLGKCISGLHYYAWPFETAFHNRRITPIALSTLNAWSYWSNSSTITLYACGIIYTTDQIIQYRLMLITVYSTNSIQPIYSIFS